MSRFVVYDREKSVLLCREQWILVNLESIEQELTIITPAEKTQLVIDGAEMSELDSGGAMLLTHWQTAMKEQGIKVIYQHFKTKYQHLMELTTEKEAELGEAEPPAEKMDLISRFGKHTVDKFATGFDLIGYIGELTIVFKGVVFGHHALQWRSLFRTVEDAGYRALPILALLSFLIGVVLAYQLGLQLKIMAQIFISSIYPVWQCCANSGHSLQQLL